MKGIEAFLVGNLEHATTLNLHVRRIGYLFNQFLIFFSGGAAFAGIEAQHYAPQGGGGALWFDTRILTGYTLGGGIETLLANNWIFRIEYLHDHFGSERYDWVPGNLAGALPAGLLIRRWGMRNALIACIVATSALLCAG